MWNGASIAVIVPAFNEEALIARMLSGVPAWVDAIYVIDDRSLDNTRLRVSELAQTRIALCVHERNRGVGAAIATGYQHALQRKMEVMVVMAGDNQMDPADLEHVIRPVVEGRADYVKGNRFIHAEVESMPFARRLGGRYLSALTRLATGLSVDDTQCGYTAISQRALARLPLNDLWPSYGYPNDLLLMLANVGARVLEVPVRPVYADESSGIRPWHLLTITRVIVSRRLRQSALANGCISPSLHRNVDVRVLVVDPVEACVDGEARET